MPLTATGSQVPWNDPGADDEDKCCCGEPEECCLYPVPVGGLYPSDDLPETLAIEAEGGPVVVTLTGSYTYTGSGWEITFDIDRWQITDPSFEIGFSPSSCLIGDYQFPSLGITIAVDDQFPDTLVMEFDDGSGISGSVEMNRVGLCQWEGIGLTIPDGFPVACQVHYEPAESEFSPLKWLCDWTAGGFGGANGTKDDPQNTPIGIYTADGGTISIS